MNILWIIYWLLIVVSLIFSIIVIFKKNKVLGISQFTLYGGSQKGNRPFYTEAMNGEKAIKLYDMFCEKLNESVPTKKGVFEADMKVSLINDGPTTIIIHSKKSNWNIKESENPKEIL